MLVEVALGAVHEGVQAAPGELEPVDQGAAPAAADGLAGRVAGERAEGGGRDDRRDRMVAAGGGGACDDESDLAGHDKVHEDGGLTEGEER